MQARQWWHTALIPVATLVSHRGWAVVTHAFNPSTREEYKMGGDRSQSQSEDSWMQKHPFWSEVEVRASDWLAALLF